MSAASAQVAPITLGPGDIAVGTRGDRLETLLGSCVAIVLTDPRRTVGAMCHYVHTHPGRPGEAQDGCYAGQAWQQMQQRLAAFGLAPAQCEAYAFGGGNMFPGLSVTLSVGELNARWALDTLQAHGLRILHHDLGGTVYRKLSWIVGSQPPRVVTQAMEPLP